MSTRDPSRIAVETLNLILAAERENARIGSDSSYRRRHPPISGPKSAELYLKDNKGPLTYNSEMVPLARISDLEKKVIQLSTPPKNNESFKRYRDHPLRVASREKHSLRGLQLMYTRAVKTIREVFGDYEIIES